MIQILHFRFNLLQEALLSYLLSALRPIDSCLAPGLILCSLTPVSITYNWLPVHGSWGPENPIPESWPFFPVDSKLPHGTD